MQDIGEYIEEAAARIAVFLPKLAGAVIILIIGWIVGFSFFLVTESWRGYREIQEALANLYIKESAIISTVQRR